ncbi:class IV adenylate cyclase [Clostridium sp. FP1]|uniref:class IV adenylate cyclase n=1 Tax=Clostridium sp. FP1 TaxID=2724076 RepID=UPI0013E93F5F|nr:CYTH domain-containing protein [Clostridium sp. FP1]MBZ9636785.1 CYTH domain-containing protein [Clostridium sp. FP1]
MKEIETRIIDIDVEEIRKKLLNINAPKVKQENQINNIYDFSDKRLIKSKGYARIRTIHDELTNSTLHYITTKKLISQEKYKIMDEHESEIKDEVAAIGIFEALGLELIQSIKKYRESYKYKNTLIEIDINDKEFCPFPYIEIESEDEDELCEVITLLGYSPSDTTSKTIYEILKSKEIVVKGL